jgi:excisionase family DNA binding protein
VELAACPVRKKSLLVNLALTGFPPVGAKSLPVYVSRLEVHLIQFIYLSTREAAQRLSIGASTLKKLRVNGGGPAFHRIGRRIVYSSEILDEWAKRATFESTSEYRSEC